MILFLLQEENRYHLLDSILHIAVLLRYSSILIFIELGNILSLNSFDTFYYRISPDYGLGPSWADWPGFGGQLFLGFGNDWPPRGRR
jgi:hypothetical protein